MESTIVFNVNLLFDIYYLKPLIIVLSFNLHTSKIKLGTFSWFNDVIMET